MLSLLSGMAIALVPHLQHLPVWLITLCCAMLIWRAGFEMASFSMPARWLKTLLVFLTLAGIFSTYHTLLGKNAGSAMLVSLLFIKLLETNNLRDIAVLVHLTLFTILIAFLFTQSIFVALLMLTVIILLFTALVGFHHPVFTLLQQKAHLVIVSRLLVQAVPFAVLLFLFFPRLSSPLWGLPQDAFSAKTGINDHMTPGLISKLTDSNEVAFRVTFADKTLPAHNRLYWRGPVLWHYDGFAWTSPKNERIAVKSSGIVKKGEPVAYSITLEPHNNFWLFALDLPDERPEYSQLSSELTLLSRSPVQQALRYSLVSYTDYFLPLNRTLPEYRYLDLPRGISPRTQQLVFELRNASSSPADFVQRTLNYFHDNEFYYSREAPILFEDPVDEFIFETRKGFCEHYASSFTVMMRMAGIPARVVIGYQGGEINPLSDYMIVHQSDAHSWSEIYLVDRGWLRIDPTTAIPASRVENLADLERIQSAQNPDRIFTEGNFINKVWKHGRYAWDAMNNRWKQWVIDFNHTRQKSLFSAFGVNEVDWRGLSTALFISLLLITIIFSLFLFRPARTTAHDPVQIYYQRFLRKLEKAGIRTHRHEGALTLSQRIRQIRPDLYEAVYDITQVYNNYRYAGQGTDIESFRRKVKQFSVKSDK